MSDKIVKYLEGSKKKPKPPEVVEAPPPVQTPDNLRSKDVLEVILGISEGPIHGLLEGAQSFYVGDTQLQNYDGSWNYQAFQLNLHPGLDEPAPVVHVLGGAASNTAVNVALATNVPVVRQTSAAEKDYIDVRIGVSRLLIASNSGTFNNSVRFYIEYKKLTDVAWTNLWGGITISGKTTSTYIKEFRIPVERTTTPYEIRVTKLTPENTQESFSDIIWESFQEVEGTSREYPNTAIIQLYGEASDQFSSIPTWSGIYRGLIVKVPSNYNAFTREYVGEWDGTFQMSWTNNPAWVLYDFVMNDRYGIRSYYPEINMDKYDVYEASQWCDELVPDGRGGFQPRYTFNAYLTEPRSGKELARYIAGSFNATFFDDLNGNAYLRVDKDDSACHVFTQENVINGEFNYSYTDITSRFNDITVTFRNPDLQWEEDRRRVIDQDLIDRNGRIPYDFIAVGTTDAHEALRKAHYKLISANTETCMVNFITNRLGQFVNPFDVILICDPDMGYGISGRVKEITNNGETIKLRTPIYLEAGVSYNIDITLSDGSRMKTSLVGTSLGYNDELHLAAPIPEDNVPDRTVFTLEHPTYIGLPRPFRVLKVVENDGSPDQYVIEGININRNKWYDSDNLTDSGVIEYSTLPDPLNPPGPISCGFEERYIKDLMQFHITVSPVFDRTAYKYYSNDHSFEVWSRPSGSDVPYQKRDIYYGDTLIDHPHGLYDFKILGKSYLGGMTSLQSAPVYQFDVTNPKEPPKPVDWARMNQREVYWGYKNPPDDFAGFIVRYHNQANRLTWDDAVQPHKGILTATSFYTNLIPSSARTILIRAVDDFGVVSTESAVIHRPLGGVSTYNVIERFDYHLGSPPWAGSKVGCAVESGELRATDVGSLMYTGQSGNSMYTGDLDNPMYGASYEEMVYIDTFTVLAAGLMNILIDFDGAGYEVNIREVGSPENAWEPIGQNQDIEPGDYEIRLLVFGGPIRGIVREFSVTIDAEDIEEDHENITVSNSGQVRVPLTRTYQAIKLVRVTIQSEVGTTAVGARVVEKDPTLGPLIELVDATGALTSGLIDVTIKGY